MGKLGPNESIRKMLPNGHVTISLAGDKRCNEVVMDGERRGHQLQWGPDADSMCWAKASARNTQMKMNLCSPRTGGLGGW